MSKFTRWREQEEFNLQVAEEEQLYTKTQLRDRFHLKPKKDERGRFISIYYDGRWRDYEFFYLSQTVEIKTRKPQEIRKFELSIENICEALYVINKSAKKSRDSKKDNYYMRRHGIVSRCKTRECELYSLKDEVMNKLIDEGKLELVGYHIQGCSMYLKYYKYSDYSFHLPSTKEEVEGLKNIGNIDGVISAVATRKVDIKYNEAIDLLYRYLDGSNEQQIC